MLFCEEVISVVKSSEYPITARKVAKKLNIPRKTVNASLLSARFLDKNLVLVLRNPGNSKKKRPIWAYKN